tara:strand:+ start:18346 stop:19152 length:807 start_codon:yes stop_codon:yes gene_type:complete
LRAKSNSLFNQQLYEQKLTTSWVGHSFIFLEEIGSTNSYAKVTESSIVSEGTVILAETQTAGHGQHRRVWEAKSGENLTFSIVFKPKNPERLSILTLACASAIYDVARKIASKNKVVLKWPNDVLIDGKKTAGILTETVFNGNILEKVIVGIGLNVNQVYFDNELADKATSLSAFSDKTLCREQLLAELLSRIEYNYQRWLMRDIELIKEINSKIVGFGEWVPLEVEGTELPSVYKFLGMNELGALQVLNKELEVNTFSYEQVRIKIG